MPKNNHKALIKIYITQNSAIVPERLPHRLSTTLCFELLGNASILQILHSFQNFLLQGLAVVDVTFGLSQRLCDIRFCIIQWVSTFTTAVRSTWKKVIHTGIPIFAFYLTFVGLSKRGQMENHSI